MMLYSLRQRPCLLASGILTLLLFSLLVPTGYVRVVTGVLFVLFACSVGYLLRKHPSHSINGRQVLMLLAACAALFQMLRFLSAFYFGFYVNYPVLSLSTFFSHILPYVMIIVASEYLRSVLLGQSKPSLAVLSYVICLVGEVAMAGGFSALGDRHRFLEVLLQTLLPALVANLVYHYLSKRYGMLSVSVYRLILVVIPACLPYAPAIPEALEAFLSVILPLAVWIFIGALYERKNTTASRRVSPWTYVGMGLTTVASCLVILLLTGQFQFGVIVIATPSMSGTLEVGDAVFYESFDEGTAKPDVEDIVLFSKDNGRTTIIHRVVEIQEKNGAPAYVTMGDANEDADHGYITSEQITGRVLFKIPYLGQAALWFRGLFN